LKGLQYCLEAARKRALRSIEGLEIGDSIRIMLNNGELDCRIEKIIRN
jgi:hypothetical protein